MKNPVVLLDEIDKLGVGWQRLARGGAARGARSRAEQDLHRPLPGAARSTCPRCSSSARPTTSATSRRRSATGWRSSSSAATRRTRRSHIARQHLIPKQLKEHAIHEGTLTITDEALARHRARLHPRGGRAAARARDQEALPRAGRSRWRAATDSKPVLRVDEADLAQLPRQGAVLRRGGRAHAACRAWPRASPGRRWAATSSSSRPRGCAGKGQLEITGQLGDVMKESRQGGALLREEPRRRSSASTLDALEDEDLHIHVPAGARAQGRAERGRDHVHGADLAALAAPGARRHGDDRRVHAARAGAARSAASRPRCWPRTGPGSRG